jgi:hypothetical protein
MIAQRPAPDLDDAMLTAPVRGALGSRDAAITEWACEPIAWTAIAATTAGIYRVSGRARDSRGEVPWMLVLKILRRPERAADDPAARTYWRREADAYASTVLDDLAGVSAPRCFGTTTAADGATVRIWLEHVSDAPERWTIARYEQAAHALGVFNGSYASVRPQPTHAWLARGFLRGWVESIAPRTRAAVTDAATWRIPVVARGFPTPMTDRIVRLCDRMPELLGAFESLPPTLSHNDSWRTNLIIPTSHRTVLIDWSWVGLSPIGFDLGILTCGSHLFFHADPDDLAAFDAAVFAAYLEGLRAAGWDDDPRRVRFAYCAGAGLWGGITAPVWLPRWGDPERRAWLEEKFGRPLEDVSVPYAATLAFMLGLADEAWSLMPVVA